MSRRFQPPMNSSNAVGGVIQLTDTMIAGGGSRFYRAHAN